MNGHQDTTNHDTPVELRATEAALDALARSERDAAPATLEARVYMATRGLLPAGAAPAVAVRPAALITRMRIAAVLAVAGGLGAMWLARAVSPTQRIDVAGLEADVDFILAMKADGMSTTRENIDALYLEADNLGQSLKQRDGSPLDEGAM